jgi:hypothetical protein
MNKLKEKAKDEQENQNAVTSDDDFTEFESYQSQNETQLAAQNTAQKIMNNRADSITHSSTTESLVDIQAVKSFTPSMTSSGYGSQAVSTLTLSSEDSASIRSMSIDETPDHVEKSKDGAHHKKNDENGEEDDTPNLIDLAVADENLLLPLKPVLPPGNVETIEDSQMKGSSSETDTESVIEASVGNEKVNPDNFEKSVENSENSLESSEEKVEEKISKNSEKEISVENKVNDSKGDGDKVVATGDQNGEIKTDHKVKGQGDEKKVDVIDLYSETAMDELEALGDENSGSKKDESTEPSTANSSDSGAGDLKKENSEDSLQSPRSECSDTATHGETKDHEKVVRRTSSEKVKLRADARKSLNLDPRIKKEARENRRSMPEHKLNKFAPSPLKPGARLPGSHDNLSVQKKKAELEESYDSDFSSSVQSLEGAIDGENDVGGVRHGAESPEGYCSGKSCSVEICWAYSVSMRS